MGCFKRGWKKPNEKLLKTLFHIDRSLGGACKVSKHHFFSVITLVLKPFRCRVMIVEEKKKQCFEVNECQQAFLSVFGNI